MRKKTEKGRRGFYRCHVLPSCKVKAVNQRGGRFGFHPTNIIAELQTRSSSLELCCDQMQEFSFCWVKFMNDCKRILPSFS